MIELKIEKISIVNEGYVHCHSCFYSSQDLLTAESKYSFSTGNNKLHGEIDSGVWAISYLLSMYNYRPKDFTLFKLPEIMVNNSVISLKDFSKFACYMDSLYPTFSSNVSISKLVLNGLKRNGLSYTPEDVRRLFHIDNERFERPLAGVGNEIFKSMAAIGFSYKKEVFCFPWLSRRRFDSYSRNLTDSLEVLESLNKTIILPIGTTAF